MLNDILTYVECSEGVKQTMIEVLDSYFAKKDILRKYTYAQYTDCFRDIGTFEIHAQLIEENLYLLDRTEQYYVLFYDGNKPIVGKVEDVKRESDEQYDTVIKLTGRLAPVLFTQRVVNGTQKFSGKTYQRVKELVTSNLIQSDKTERNVNITINLLNESIMQMKASREDKEVTGGYVWDEIQSSLETDSFGIDFYPVLSMPTGENKTNITSWVLDISPGNDRRKGNTEGNIPIVFSQQLSNIERTDYERNIKDYRNVAYVAGEGEKNERKWYEVEINQNIEQKVLTGWGRKELWIDARDIQSENGEGTKLTDKEYEALIEQRANEKASENTVQETYEATKTEADKRYQYGVDYLKGDWVTVEDRNLNIVVDAQITEVIHTIQGSKEIVDITFSYGQMNKDPVKQIANTKELAEKNDNNIKYVENRTKTLDELVKGLSGVSIYKSTEGTKLDFELSESIENFDYIIVLFGSDIYTTDMFPQCSIVLSTKYSKCQAKMVYMNNSNETITALQLEARTVTFSGENASMGIEKYVNFSTIKDGVFWHTAGAGAAHIKVYEVVGIKVK